ncbi:ABC transporter ATP-binding protein [Actinopolymorpha pittospori]|uniref:Peptide/nickel transport system ATP-binding protein n=1 Tax=Actinopolymorpha pittospori TaxID=648752 RepID=A0A927MUS1_9ACTN|nr:ABC transporter ATP-binding protein [Actinopolymorpha pittospori]MBE1603685.1 peptide/nickel transport system ATP-binding protein [Actinopolymorpha pittospori]
MLTEDVLLSVEGLKTHFFLDEGVVRSVDGVSLTVPRGRTVCVVGESGCGKSVTARSILGLVDPPGRIVEGNIWLRRPPVDKGLEVAGDSTRARSRRGSTKPSGGLRTKAAGGRSTKRGPRTAEGADRIDLAVLDPHGEELRQVRGNEISMVFQEPMASLSPMYTVAQHLVEAIMLHRRVTRKDAWSRGVALLERVGIPRPEQRMDSYPFQLSGGMCQRVMIAIALACEPSLLIADEPTTALDVTTQARIIDLLTELQADTGMAMLFITHDLGVVAEVADEVVVMYLGTVVEQGSVDDIFHHPQHPYTKALLTSVPTMGSGVRQRKASIRGEVPHPLNRPPGCPYHPRCEHAIAGLCDTVDPPQVRVGPSLSRCVLHDAELLHAHGVDSQRVRATFDAGEEK